MDSIVDAAVQGVEQQDSSGGVPLAAKRHVAQCRIPCHCLQEPLQPGAWGGWKVYQPKVTGLEVDNVSVQGRNTRESSHATSG